MSVDIVRQLDKAKKFVERNRIDDAIGAYQEVLSATPNHMETIQALGDLYTMKNQPDRAAYYYGMLFDRFTTPREEPKAIALYTRFLKQQQQPPERVARYALLLQKQNRTAEAIEQFTAAALAFELSGKAEDALASFMRIAQLEPDNRDRHVAVAELAERLGNEPAAARGFLRAAQLTTQNDGEALGFFAKAHSLLANDRSVSLLYAQALLRKGDAGPAAELLKPMSETEKDAAFLETYAEALTRSGQLEAAGAILDRMGNQGGAAGAAVKLISLAKEYLGGGQDEKAMELLSSAKKSMFAARRESEFAAAVDQLADAFPKSLPLTEFWASLYAELNRESKYFDALARLFDLYLEKDQVRGACDALEKLVEIDPYDSRNQERMNLLNGRASEELLSRVKSRLSTAAPLTTAGPALQQRRVKPSEPSTAVLKDVNSGHTLEDLLVQAEIFIQYSLQSKAVERLQRIAELFPGEEERNERLQGLFEAANWWPEESARPRRRQSEESVQTLAEASPNRTGVYSAETLRDLAKISEINQNVFRQPSARAMLSAAVNEVGNYLKASRCLALVGSPGAPPQMASEFCSSGMQASNGAQIVRLNALVETATPDSSGGLPLDVSSAPILRELGLETSLAVQLNDPEKQTPAGKLIVGFAGPHTWKPNETYFLQSIGDQMLLCVQHTRLRSLVQNMAVADENTGLLTRGSYIDCLLREARRSRAQNVPLALALLQIDGGPELLRQQGEGPFDRVMEQLGKAVQSIVRQTDLAIKYTSWALAIVLPDTPLAGAQILAEKLRKAAGLLRPPWDGGQLTTSVAVAEAITRQDFDNEDIVTELINRAEGGLEEARKRGGNEIISLEMAKN